MFHATMGITFFSKYVLHKKKALSKKVSKIKHFITFDTFDRFKKFKVLDKIEFNFLSIKLHKRTGLRMVARAMAFVFI